MDCIFVERISSVDQDIAFVQMWKKGLIVASVPGHCLNHEHDPTWFFRLSLRNSRYHSLARSSFQDGKQQHLLFFFLLRVIDSNCVSTRFNIKGKVTTHYGHTNNTKVCFCHVTLSLYSLPIFYHFLTSNESRKSSPALHVER